MDDCDSPYHLIVEYDYVIIDGICSEPQALHVGLTTRFRNFDHTNMLKNSFESVETISEQGKLNQCLIYWKTRVYLIYHHWREGASVFNLFSPRELRLHNSCTRYLQYPPHNDAHVCHCQKCNLSGQCSHRTRPSYTHFFHHSRDRQNSVKTDAMSKITMQYIITQFNLIFFSLRDAIYSEKWCREHQRTFLSNIFFYIAKSAKTHAPRAYPPHTLSDTSTYSISRHASHFLWGRLRQL